MAINKIKQINDLSSDLERKFIYYWKLCAQDLGFPEPIPQFRFDSNRRWRLDFAWPEYKLAVEIDGAGGGGYGRRIICQNCGTPVRSQSSKGPGRLLYVPYPSHGSGAGKDRDAEKANALTLAGWDLLRYTSSQLEENPYLVIEQVARKLLINKTIYDFENQNKCDLTQKAKKTKITKSAKFTPIGVIQNE